MSYAETTTVSVAKTKGEIEHVLTVHGADKFAHLSEDGRAVIVCELKKRRLQFTLRLPMIGDFLTYRDRWGKLKERTPEKQRAEWEQSCRSHWRALYLTIKAKLVSVEAKVETLEEAFLAQIVIPGQKGTFGDWSIPQIHAAYDRGKQLPPLLPARTV